MHCVDRFSSTYRTESAIGDANQLSTCMRGDNRMQVQYLALSQGRGMVLLFSEQSYLMSSGNLKVGDSTSLVFLWKSSFGIDSGH